MQTSPTMRFPDANGMGLLIAFILGFPLFWNIERSPALAQITYGHVSTGSTGPGLKPQ